MAVIRWKASFTIAVNSQRNRLSFSVVNDLCTAVYDRSWLTWDVMNQFTQWLIVEFSLLFYWTLIENRRKLTSDKKNFDTKSVFDMKEKWSENLVQWLLQKREHQQKRKRNVTRSTLGYFCWSCVIHVDWTNLSYFHFYWFVLQYLESLFFATHLIGWSVRSHSNFPISKAQFISSPMNLVEQQYQKDWWRFPFSLDQNY